MRGNDASSRSYGLDRREFLRILGTGALTACQACSWAWLWSGTAITDATQDNPGVFKRGAPDDATFQAWQKRGWVREAQFYHKRGSVVQCSICPNRCVLEPGDRSHCRTRINRDGTLYTLAYGNPCTFHIDPVEKKPLFHFLPGARTFSLAIAGCVLRCMNCQNWDISQKRPEETKRADGPETRMRPGAPPPTSLEQLARMSMFPEDVVANARAMSCQAIAYTYSEPIAWYEYTFDTAKLAHTQQVRNILVTSGYIRPEPLRELAPYLDAAHVDLKGFDEQMYMRLNSGHLQPVLDALLTLKSCGVWFEIINLIVPTYTDNIALIRQMCTWIAEKLGADVPLHFSRFHPAHRLTHLPPTPIDSLVAAREQARAAGLNYVYIGNVRGVSDAGTTFCPACRKAIIRRDVFTVVESHLIDGKCAFCRTPIAGVWK